MTDEAPPRIRFLILNLRMGGQVSSILSLQTSLQACGIDAELLLPGSARSASKRDLTAYASLPAARRLRELWALVRGLRALAADDRLLLHLVVPSPAFLPILHMLPFPAERVIVQYEGPSTRLNREHARALFDDPIFILPRLIINNRFWMQAGRGLSCTHIAAHPSIAAELRHCGQMRVFEIPNSGLLEPCDPKTQIPTPFRRGEALPAFCNDEIWCAYVGHAHPVKGVDDLVEAFAHAVARRPQLRLLMALSSDGNAARIRQFVASRRLDRVVRVLGLVSVSEVLKSIDVLVLPYRSAITTTLYPSLLLEADEAGCPVLVAALPELTPVFNMAYCGLRVFPPRSVSALADALLATPKRTSGTSKRFLHLPTGRERVERTMAAYRATMPSDGNAGTLPRH